MRDAVRDEIADQIDRLEQVVQNLLLNAIKYSPDGGTVSVQVNMHDDEIWVSVADEGIGIPPEALPHLFRRFYRSDPILSLLLTFGLAMVGEQTLRIIFGAAPLPYAIPDWLRGQFFLGNFILSRYRLAILALVVLLVAATWFLLQRTPFGRVVRAGVQNPDMVGALGISLEPYMMAIAALGVGLAGLCGVLLAPIYSVFPTMGRDFILMAFTVVIVGGMGSIAGAVVAGLFLTQVQAIASLYISPVWTDPIVFGIMVVVLMVCPQGLFGRLGHA